MKNKIPLLVFPVFFILASRAHGQTQRVEAPIIKGLVAVDVHGNLTNKGFTLAKKFSTVQNEWKVSLTAANLTYDVGIFGTDPMEITAVVATISGTAETVAAHAADFLQYVAKLPYDGANPAGASAWVTSNANRNASTVIGGVKFQIFANVPTARMLRISPAG